MKKDDLAGKEAVLLHICCGVCAGWAIEKLKADGYSVTGYFYNPNISPEDEYVRRLEACRSVCESLGVPLIEGGYDLPEWEKAAAGFENEKEGGRRCEICFRFRLEETARQAGRLGIPFSTTTLTIGPHKNAELINKIGKSIARDKFLEYNFKKEDGFKKTSEFARSHDIYRQHYCGCIYSLKDASLKGRGK